MYQRPFRQATVRALNNIYSWGKSLATMNRTNVIVFVLKKSSIIVSTKRRKITNEVDEGTLSDNKKDVDESTIKYDVADTFKSDWNTL